MLRQGQRLQWLRVKTKPKRPKMSAVRKPSGSSRPATRKNAARNKIRLLIADDHALILEGLAATICRQGDMTVVAKASNGREAVELWTAHRPDVSLLDLRMPKLNGVGVIREVRDLDVSARVIVHTTYDTDEEIYQAVMAGATYALRTVVSVRGYSPTLGATRCDSDTSRAGKLSAMISRVRSSCAGFIIAQM